MVGSSIRSQQSGIVPPVNSLASSRVSLNAPSFRDAFDGGVWDEDVTIAESLLTGSKEPSLGLTGIASILTDTRSASYSTSKDILSQHLECQTSFDRRECIYDYTLRLPSKKAHEQHLKQHMDVF